MGWSRRAFGSKDRPSLRLSQSLGAFARPDGGISPLHVFFEVTNTGAEEVVVARVYVSAGGGPVHEESFGEEHALPLTMEAGASARFQTRAKALARDLKEAGYEGRPRIYLVVEDARGNRREKSFKFRVDDYLRLKDE